MPCKNNLERNTNWLIALFVAGTLVVWGGLGWIAYTVVINSDDIAHEVGKMGRAVVDGYNGK